MPAKFLNGQTNRTCKKYFSLYSHLKVIYFNSCEIFLQRNQSDLFLESRRHFTRIEQFLQNGRHTALTGLTEDRPQYILKTRIIEFQTSFRLRQFFAATLRKWWLNFLPRRIASVIGERCERKSGLIPRGVLTLHDYGYLPPEFLKSYPVSE